MMKIELPTLRIIVTILLGGTICFAWNAISWTALPFHSNSLQSIPDDAIQTDSLRSLLPKDGVYHYPGLPKTTEELAVVEQRLKSGPRITLMVYKSGPTSLWNPVTFVWSLLLNFVTVGLTLLIASLISRKTFKSVLGCCLLMGIVISVVADFGQMNWHLFPFDYTLANVMDRIIPFGLLGVLLGSYTFKSVDP